MLHLHFKITSSVDGKQIDIKFKSKKSTLVHFTWARYSRVLQTFLVTLFFVCANQPMASKSSTAYNKYDE